MSAGTVNPNRYISEDERKALVTIEVAERLAVKAHNLLNGKPTETDLRRAQRVLAELAGQTTSRTCTAVKHMWLSDEIARVARGEVVASMSRVERDLTPMEGSDDRD